MLNLQDKITDAVEPVKFEVTHCVPPCAHQSPLMFIPFCMHTRWLRIMHTEQRPLSVNPPLSVLVCLSVSLYLCMSVSLSLGLASLSLLSPESPTPPPVFLSLGIRRKQTIGSMVLCGISAPLSSSMMTLDCHASFLGVTIDPLNAHPHLSLAQPPLSVHANQFSH